jgi:hypothetical protein
LLEDETIKRKFFYALDYLWVPIKAGKISFSFAEEKSVGSLLLKFIFTFEKEVKIDYKWDVVKFYPWEVVALFDIRSYCLENFVKFLDQNGFDVVKQEEVETSWVLSFWHILLKKKMKEELEESTKEKVEDLGSMW